MKKIIARFLSLFNAQKARQKAIEEAVSDATSLADVEVRLRSMESGGWKYYS